MGVRGPAPAPTSLKLLHGTRSDRVNTSEPVPAQGEVQPPAWLDEDALQVWNRLAPDLTDKGILTPWDTDAFGEYCALVVVNRNAMLDVARNGTTITTVERELSNGTLLFHTSKNPAWQVARESATLLVTYGGRFGLNPSARSQLSIQPAEKPGKGAERLLS